MLIVIADRWPFDVYFKKSLDPPHVHSLQARPDLKMELFHLMSFLLSYCTSKWKAANDQVIYNPFVLHSTTLFIILCMLNFRLSYYTHFSMVMS